MAIERVALIGFGAIGAAVERIIRQEQNAGSTLVAVLVRPGFDRSRFTELASNLFVENLPALLEPQPTLVLECASHSAVDQYGATVLQSESDLLVTSIGALADAHRLSTLTATATACGRQILLPAGAIAGVDWLAASRRSGLERVIYRSRKPPQAWHGTPAQVLLKLDTLSSAHTFFDGNAREAAQGYPKNANVAATIALAGLGFEATQVQLIADPKAAGNQHEIEASGPAGELQLTVLGQPDPSNPKTSMLTAYSIARTVLNRRTAICL